jgi:hypothetical protein
MSSYVEGAFIGGGFVLAGVLVTTVRDAITRKAEHRAVFAARLEGAMREYLAVLDALASEVSDMPAVPKQTALDRWLDRVAERTSFDIITHIVLRVLRRAVYGKRPDELVDRMALASTQLRLIAPDSVLAIMREIDAATERAGPGGVGWHREWKSMRDHVRGAFRKELAAAAR